MKNDNKSTKGLVKKLTKALTFCLCCVLMLGALCYIAPPLKTHAEVVTDLVDTTWYLSNWTYNGTQQEYYVSGKLTAENTSKQLSSGTVLRLTSSAIVIDYMGSYTYTFTPNQWFAFEFDTISTYNSSYDLNILTILFNEYGTQLKVTDLTDTTWNVRAGWEVDADYTNGYDDYLNGSVNYDNNSIDFTQFGLGSTYDDYEGEVVDLANNIRLKGVDNGDYNITPASSFTVTFNGGRAVTSVKQIAWLSKYGELQGSEEPEPEPDPEPETITTHTPTTPVGFVGFYQDIIFPSLNGLGDTSSTNPVGIARLNGETGIVIGTTAYSGLVLWTEVESYTTFYPWYSLQNDIDEQVNVQSGDLILSALTSEGGMVDIAIIKPYNKGTENTYIYINTAQSSSYKQSMTAYDENIYYLGADGGGVADYEYSYVEVDVDNRTYTIPTVADEDATNTWALFQRLNSQWFAEISSYNVGVSSEFGNNLIIDTLKAPFTILDSFTLFVVNGTAITLAHIFGALIGLSLFFLFLKLFAGG